MVNDFINQQLSFSFEKLKDKQIFVLHDLFSLLFFI